jgi:hypothetical protein
LACFDATFKVLRAARATEGHGGRTGNDQSDRSEGLDYARAADAMFDFLAAVGSFESVGKNLDRQALADETIAHVLKVTGN